MQNWTQENMNVDGDLRDVSPSLRVGKFVQELAEGHKSLGIIWKVLFSI